MKEIVAFSKGALGEGLGAVRPGWLAGWLAGGWLAGRLAGWPAGWLAGCDTTKMLFVYGKYEDFE